MRSDPLEESALLDVVLRLARQVEQQVQQLRRMRDAEQRVGRGDGAVAAGLGDLERSAHRIRRDSERVRLLCGADLGSSTLPMTLSEVLGEAVAAAEEPSRVTVRVAPVATIGSQAGVELRYVLAALLDSVTADSGPGRRISVSCRLGSAGLAVDVVVDGEPWDLVPLGPGLADVLARRTATGIHLERPLAGPGGVLATVYCPAAVLIVPAEPKPMDGVGPAMQVIGRSTPPSRPVGGDALFGPLRVPSGRVDDMARTPIYEAVASAWFQDPSARNGSDPPRDGTALDWDSPGDAEWRTAAARAARPDTGTTTAAGLPQRRPGHQMVVPPLDRSRRAQADPDERVPDRVRDRLNDYQRGLRQGRHRAPAPPAESDGWWSEPTA